jgi:hypothetical protein
VILSPLKLARPLAAVTAVAPPPRAAKLLPVAMLAVMVTPAWGTGRATAALDFHDRLGRERDATLAGSGAE